MKTARFLMLALITAAISIAPAQTGSTVAPTTHPRLITIDINKVKGPFSPMFKECVGAGRANEGLRADWQAQLAVVKKECDFTYLRMHGLLTDDMGVYKEDRKGNPEYNFQYIDVLYDYLLSIGMKPFVELGFMPSALASGTQTVFWWKGNITPPKDYQKWGDLIRALTLHFTQRYGADEVKSWYFEVWNEPNLNFFWSGSQEEYFKLYRYTVQAIKGINKDYRVGGPATAGAAWVPEMINFCSTNHLLLDFVSTHSYGVKQGFLDENGSTGTILDRNPWSVSGDILNSRKQISASPMPHLELHYTEWSSSYTPADPIHDSYHEASYILQKIKQVGNAPTSMSYWTFTDIFEEAGPRFTPFHGGFGLLNYQGIKKPAFYAFAYLNKLGKTELLDNDSCSWACKNTDKDVQLLFWDFSITHPGDSVNDQAYYVRDLPAKPRGRAKVSISGLAEGTYMLEVYRIGYRVNDPYATYLALNKPQQLTKDEVETIKRLNDGSPVTREIVRVTSSGVFATEVEQRENDVYLFRLTKP
ncbi:MAG TPA: glycoside hydrolase [Bacteroidota bacterium]|nr:glycoside hydrolase [Bacteroidota bacterium]